MIRRATRFGSINKMIDDHGFHGKAPDGSDFSRLLQKRVVLKGNFPGNSRPAAKAKVDRIILV